MEARRTAGLNNAPPCLWSPTPPLELKGAPTDALSANAGFVSFGNVTRIDRVCYLHFHSHHNKLCRTENIAVIFPRHVEGKKLDRTVWNLSTFHAYVSYHVKVRFLFQYIIFHVTLFHVLTLKCEIARVHSASYVSSMYNTRLSLTMKMFGAPCLLTNKKEGFFSFFATPELHNAVCKANGLMPCYTCNTSTQFLNLVV